MHDVDLERKIRYINPKEFEPIFIAETFSTYANNVTANKNFTFSNLQRMVGQEMFCYGIKEIETDTHGLINTSYTDTRHSSFAKNLNILTRINRWDIRISPDATISLQREQQDSPYWHFRLELDILHIERTDASLQHVHILYEFGTEYRT